MKKKLVFHPNELFMGLAIANAAPRAAAEEWIYDSEALVRASTALGRKTERRSIRRRG